MIVRMSWIVKMSKNEGVLMNQSGRCGGCDPRHTKKHRFNHRLNLCQTCEVCIGDRKYSSKSDSLVSESLFAVEEGVL